MRMAGADPGFDQGGAPDRDRPKTAILGPQFCRIFGAGASFLVVGGGGARAPAPPPLDRPLHGTTVYDLVCVRHLRRKAKLRHPS